MADFNDALAFVLKREGGYADHPLDKGGPTNKGITTKTYDAYRRAQGLPVQDVRQISDVEVRDIYYRQYWLAVHADRQPYPMALTLFDTAVNMGPGVALELLRVSDGSVDAYLKLRKTRYFNIVARDPSQRVFLSGWMTRLDKLRYAATGETGGVTTAGLGIIALLAIVGALLRRG